MRFLAILSLLILTAAGCQKRSDKALRQRAAARFLMQKSQEDTVLYRLAASFDPYDGGQFTIADSNNPSYLQLHSQGTFLEYDSLNQSSGLWYVNKIRDRVKLVYQIQNGEEIPIAYQDTFFRYQLVRLTEDSLILGIQGRHGIVQKTFIQEKLPQADSLLQPRLDSIKSDSAPPPPKEKSVPANPMAPEQTLMEQDSANIIFFGDASSDTASWRLFSVYNPYEKILPEEERSDSVVDQPDNPNYLQLTRMGTFIRSSPNNYEIGKWYLGNSNLLRMKFVITVQNGQEIPFINQDRYFRYQLKKSTEDTLILGVQGREGMVRYTYLRCPNDSIIKPQK